MPSQKKPAPAKARVSGLRSRSSMNIAATIGPFTTAMTIAMTVFATPSGM